LIRKLRLLLFLLLAAVFSGYAQIPVLSPINAVPVSGCAPLAVSFNGSATNSPTYFWNFGGAPPNVTPATSNTQNTSALFTTPGMYTVTLTATNASGTSVPQTVIITVNPSPTADFDPNKTTGCFPTTISFTNTSSGNGSTITGWIWDFGDGNLDSTNFNPNHIYHSGGSFPVTLSVKNNFGCLGKASVKNVAKAITLSNGVFADYSPTINTTCTLPVSTTFTNQTTGPPALSYLWDFGDASPLDPSVSPTHNYTSAGNYTVKLVANSSQGCVDTFSTVVNISASGNLSDFSGAGNVCINTITNFLNTSSPPPASSTWDYGDGSPIDNARNGQHTYTTPGTYHVVLTNNFSGCTGTVTKDVTVVGPPVTAFTATNVNACSPPLTTQFNDATPGATSWLWDFGDGTTSTIQNPSHMYNSLGSFTVSLTASSAGGCTNKLSKPALINIAKPLVSITNSPAYGCAPFVYSPTISVTAVDGVATYSWDFNNGFTYIGLTPPPQTYAAGVYNITLTITTNGGCVATAAGVVKVGAMQPTPLFTAVPTTACVGQPIQFTDQSTGGANQWFWDFGDGSTDATENPLYSYTKPGTFDVTLTAYNNGCLKKLTKLAYITINPPLANFGVAGLCGAQNNFTFSDSSLGATSWLWDFGDGSPTSGGPGPITHVYPAGPQKNYTVSLTVTNGTCSNTKTKVVTANQVTTVFTSSNPVCNNTLITIFSSAPANTVGYLFDFGDGSPKAGSGSGATSHTYTSPGDYLITVMTTDNTGCTQTSPPYTMHISGPTVKFTTPTTVSCGPLAATFTDQSVPSPGTTLKSWAWDFGDGVTSAIENPPVHNYMFQGIFPVSLKVTDNNGCSDSLVVPNYITVSVPIAKFITDDSDYCPSSNIKFTNASSGGFNPVYTWDFKDGSTFTGANPPLHNYPTVGTYPVSLTITDDYHCTSGYSAPSPINIDVPVSAFTLSASFSACPPLNEKFTFTGHYASTYTWNFDNGGSSIIPDPSSIYTLPGDYDPVLTIVSPGGCISSSTQHIHIDGPIGAFTYSPFSACDSLTVNFQVTTSNVVSFGWNFNDGDTLTTPTPSASHLYNKPGSYTPFVTLIDAAGCKLTEFGTQLIQIDSIAQTAFNADKTLLCDSGTVNFNSTSLVAAGTNITNYIWDFGDGSPVVSGLNPAITHDYILVGSHNATLNITTAGGCSGSFSLPINVVAKPQVTINGVLNQCEPAVLSFTGVLAVPDPTVVWLWNFGNGQSSTVQNPTVSYPKAGEYIVQLTATNGSGCSNVTDSADLKIFPIPVVNAGADTTICLGTPLQLNASGEATIYNWLPPADGSLSCTNCPNPVATPAASISYILNGSSPEGCQAKDTIHVTVNTPVTVNAGAPDSVCLGQSIRLNATGAAIYSWTPSEGLNNPNIGNPLATPDATQAGSGNSSVITYQVTGYDSKKCFSDVSSVNITVFNYPVVSAGPNVTINVGKSFPINATASGNIVALNWTPSNTLSCSSCLTPVAKPTKTTKYDLAVTNDGGCTTTDSITIQVVCTGANFFVPNSFSPNGDGVNDHFIVNGIGLNVIPSITIYNRWGQIVFQKSNFAPNTIADAWDGTFNGKPAPSDVYIYTLQILCDNATLIPYHGNVTLIR
jgi:gliding motility-associated-like protein